MALTRVNLRNESSFRRCELQFPLFLWPCATEILRETVVKDAKKTIPGAEERNWLAINNKNFLGLPWVNVLKIRTVRKVSRGKKCPGVKLGEKRDSPHRRGRKREALFIVIQTAGEKKKVLGDNWRPLVQVGNFSWSLEGETFWDDEERL